MRCSLAENPRSTQTDRAQRWTSVSCRYCYLMLGWMFSRPGRQAVGERLWAIIRDHVTFIQRADSGVRVHPIDLE